MIYFALNEHGNLHGLGDHGDFDSAELCAEDMGLDSCHVFDEHSARSYVNFINEQLATVTSTN